MMTAVKHHWPEYFMEAAGLGLFMISACGFAMCKRIQLQIVTPIAVLLSLVGIAVPVSQAADILFLGADDPPIQGDPGAIEHLESLGHTVTYMIGEEAFADDASGRDLVVISSTLLRVHVVAVTCVLVVNTDARNQKMLGCAGRCDRCCETSRV